MLTPETTLFVILSALLIVNLVVPYLFHRKTLSRVTVMKMKQAKRETTRI